MMTDHEPLSETERAFWHRSTSLTSSEGWRKAFKRALFDIDDLREQLRYQNLPHERLSWEQALELIARSSDGLTVDELEMLGRYQHQTASARVHDLEARGLICNKGLKRRRTRSGRTAIVWRVTEADA